MTEQIKKLFDDIKKYGHYTREKKLDGFKQWIKLKSILSEIKTEGKWNPKVRDFFVEMRADLKLQECENELKGSDTEKHETWEKHHFYLQHARIPTLNYSTPTLIRLMQIAYNAGQLKAAYNDEIYTSELKQYYKKII